MGAWSYVGPRIYTASAQTQYHKGKYPRYAGRDPTSSVATGSKVCCFGIYYFTPQVLMRLQTQHKREIEMFLNDAFGVSSS